VRVLVVHESLFGNTREVAQAVAEGVRAGCPGACVDCVSVDEAVAADSLVDLLVIGGPTHFWGMTSRISRALEYEYELHLRRGPRGDGRLARDIRKTRGMRGWLVAAPAGGGAAAAAFDTRMAGALTGGAAWGIARRLRRHGYQLIAEPRSFLVDGVGGPLHAEELAKASRWGRELARTILHERPPGAVENHLSVVKSSEEQQ
jgi:hypothetical protein